MSVTLGHAFKNVPDQVTIAGTDPKAKEQPMRMQDGLQGYTGKNAAVCNDQTGIVNVTILTKALDKASDGDLAKATNAFRESLSKLATFCSQRNPDCALDVQSVKDNIQYRDPAVLKRDDVNKVKDMILNGKTNWSQVAADCSLKSGGEAGGNPKSYEPAKLWNLISDIAAYKPPPDGSAPKASCPKITFNNIDQFPGSDGKSSGSGGGTSGTGQQ